MENQGGTHGTRGGTKAPDLALPGEGGAAVIAFDGTEAHLFPKVDGHVREVLAAL